MVTDYPPDLAIYPEFLLSTQPDYKYGACSASFECRGLCRKAEFGLTLKVAFSKAFSAPTASPGKY